MPNDQSASQGRRPHYHRGRRAGGDRRPPDRRPTPGPQEQAGRDHVDVEQIMRDIRARIAKRHGIDLSGQQIRELAARRLEAILEPRHVAPSLMEQMRRAAGESIEVPLQKADTPAGLDESALYASHRASLHRIRRWLNPILKLFFNPTPLVEAMADLTRRSNAAAAREAELHARQAEWNALHFEILQRLVTEVARATIEMQGLTARVESLAAKADFNERRVRTLEGSGAPTAAKPVTRPVDQAASQSDRPTAGSSPDASTAPTAPDGEGQRRRRRRRRGRRGGGPSIGDAQANAGPMPSAPAPEFDADVDGETDAEDMDADTDMEGTEPASMTGTVDDVTESRVRPGEGTAPFQGPRESVPRPWEHPEASAAPLAPGPSPGRIETTQTADTPAEPSPRRDEPGAPEQ
jgi:hypothetical protein